MNRSSTTSSRGRKANRMTAHDAAERVARVLQCARMADANGATIGYPSLKRIRGDAEGDTLSFSVTFEIKLDLDGEP